MRRSKPDWEMEKMSMREGEKKRKSHDDESGSHEVREEVHEEESSCRSTKQGEACLQGVRTMRAKGAHSGGEQESGEAHDRER